MGIRSELLISVVIHYVKVRLRKSPLGNPAGSHLNRYVKNQLGVNPNEVRK
ncbi:MAG: hypothetical protein II540_04805 [Paludibacteraceae bacterium]|nr:hypothetical protein [Paludibacteraceae bacterium]